MDSRIPKDYPNLRPADPWPKGVSGNPAGLKKGTKHGIVARVRRLLEKTLPDEMQGEYRKLANGGSIAAALAAVLILKGLDGSLQAIQTILQFTELGSTEQDLVILLPGAIADSYAADVAKLQRESKEQADNGNA